MTAPIRKPKAAARARRRLSKENGAHAALARAEEFARILERLGPLDPVDAAAEPKPAQPKMQAADGAEAAAQEKVEVPETAPRQRVTADKPFAPRDLIYVVRSKSAEAERIRALRARLFTTAAEKIDCFAVAGIGARARIAYLGANLAASFACAGRKTLLMDADFRRPRLDRFFRIRAEAGLSEVVSGDAAIEDAAVASCVDGLSLLSAGGLAGEERFTSASLTPVLEAAKASYDHVIVLTGPHGAGAHAQFVWAATGRALVAVRRAEARADETRQYANIMRQLGAEILGAVLTD